LLRRFASRNDTHKIASEGVERSSTKQVPRAFPWESTKGKAFTSNSTLSKRGQGDLLRKNL
jgi:hypothetical protein